MSTATPNPFAERSATNPHGALRRDVVITRAADAPEDGPVEIALSSEAPVERCDWMTGERYIEVLDHSLNGGPDLSYARDGLPFCLDHEIDDQIGLVEGLTIGADRVLRGTVRQGNHPDASWLFADMRGGIRKKVSIGYWPGETYTSEKNAAGQIVRRYVGWTLYEASSVSVPADYEVGVGRNARGIASNESVPAAADKAHTMERDMSGIDNASERGAAPAPDTRPQELAALAKDSGMESRLADWLVNSTSVMDARAEVIKQLKANASSNTVSTASPAPVTVKERAEDKPWQAGEFWRAVIQADQAPELMDVRLKAQRAGTGANVGNNAEGGFAVPPGDVNIMFDTMYKSGEILSRVDRRPITNGNTYSERLVKETSRANSSRFGGLLAGWTAENGSISATKPELREVNLSLKKLAAAAYLTEEQLADGPALLSYISRVVPEEMRFQTENAIWAGTGAGQPLGILNAGSLVSVAIEASQTIANTAGNIWVNAAKMFGAMPASLLGGAAYFINQELWAKILTATAGTGSASVPMFTPPGQLESLPNGGIYGKPIVPIEYASAEGTVGDIVFANFSDYLMIDKGGINQAVSMHVRFLNDEQVLKFTYRVDGSPRTLTAMTPFKGSQTQSPYIALAARS